MFHDSRGEAEDPSSLRSLGMTKRTEERGKRKEERAKRKEQRGKSEERSQACVVGLKSKPPITPKIPKSPKIPIIPVALFALFHYLYLRSAESSDPLRSVAGACFDLFVLILFRSLRPFGCVLLVA